MISILILIEVVYDFGGGVLRRQIRLLIPDNLNPLTHHNVISQHARRLYLLLT
jgi:hypothetical protein